MRERERERVREREREREGSILSLTISSGRLLYIKAAKLANY